MKLLSMTDFVLQQDITDIKQRDSIVKYANFLKQPLKLEMFIPCDEDGNIIELLHDIDYMSSRWTYYGNEVIKYRKAKEKVLFEDSILIDETMYHQTKRLLIMLKSYPTFRIFNQFYYHDGSIERQLFPNNENLTIEDLIQFELELTESAIKQIGI